MGKKLDQIKELLRDKNLKATSSRINLLEKMQSYKSAIPYSHIQQIMKSNDRVTIYRTLETLTGKGVIHQAYQDENDIYYAICGVKCNHEQHDHNHIHFKCISCGQVTCKPLDSNHKISLPDHQILDVSIHVKGICEICN